MKPTTLWLARHGETTWAAKDLFNGWSDTPLTDRGRAQAQGLGATLKDQPLAAIYSSTLQRTVTTAQLAGEPHNLAPLTEPRIKELDYGTWDGLTRDEIIDRYPQIHAAWDRDPASVAPPSGETGYDVLARIVPVFREWVARHAGQAFLVVAHKTVNRLFLCTILGVPPRNYRRRIGQHPGALNRITWIDGEPRVTLMNHTAHETGGCPALNP